MVYVDTMRAPYGRLILCHMIADSPEELNAMADGIGVDRKWHQGNHYDICLTKRAKALQAGAVEISFRQCGAMIARYREEGRLGRPEDAVAWLRAYRRAQPKQSKI